MTKPELISRPYRCPDTKVGSQVYCEYHAGDVEVAGIVKPPVGPWPAYARIGGVMTPILTGDLVRAVRTESVKAVAYWWGVSCDFVSDWRRALGVGRFNHGTTALWSKLVDQRLPKESRRRGGKASGKIMSDKWREKRKKPTRNSAE